MSKKIEEKVNRSFTSATPDMSKQVIADCQNTTVYRTQPKRNGGLFWKIATIALALMLVVTGVFGGIELGSTAQAAVVGIDVNPSIEIKVDGKNRVIEVIANNDDALEILAGMDLKGAKLDVAVYAIIGSMASRGILSDLTNSVLVSVDAKKQATYEEIIKAVTEKINVTLKEYKIEASVVSQWMVDKDEITRIATTYDISRGKAQLVAKIMKASTGADGTSIYTEEALANTSVNELAIILSQYASEDLGEIVTNGVASQKGYIGKEKALELALAEAGIEFDPTVDTGVDLRDRVGFDIEHGQLLYEVEFVYGGFEYEVDVVAVDGTIAGFEMEVAGRHVDDENLPNLETDAEFIAKATEGVEGVTNAYVSDRDDDKVEVKFETETHRYEVEVTLKGTIISKEIKSKAQISGAQIAEGKIKQIVLDMLARQNVDVSFLPEDAIECELDDEGRYYEVEVGIFGMEFEFKFDAKTGEPVRYQGGHGFGQGNGDGYHGGK